MVVVAVLALAVRLVIIRHSRGGADLRIYTYFARLALRGLNPFAPPSGGEFPALESDNPPVEIAGFAGLLAIHNSPTTLRLLFALSDSAVILLVGISFARSLYWRAAFVLFYAFNPLVLVTWTGFAEDKTIVFLGIAVWLWALDREMEWTSWIAAAALTAVKFLGTYAAPALALRSVRRGGSKATLPVLLFLACFALSYAPWFPQSIDTFSRRNKRLDTNPPIHASWTLLLSRVGLYSPIEAKLLTPLALGIVLTLYVRHRLDIRDTVVWALFAGFIFLPNNALNRILLVSLPFVLVLELSELQWMVMWLVSTLVALAFVVATRGVPHALLSIAGPMQSVFARESTVRHVLWMNLLPAMILGFYFRERRAQTGSWA